MILRPSQNAIPIDTFVSTSGRYLCSLMERYEPSTRGNEGALRGYWFFGIDRAGKTKPTLRYLGTRDVEAFFFWETTKEKLTAKADIEEPVDEWSTEKMPFHNCKVTEGELKMLRLNPVGAVVFVRDIQPVDEVTARAEAAGLLAVVAPENAPPSTMGVILKVGTDPFLTQELGLAPGWVVTYSKHSTRTFMESGQEYRIIGAHEIVGTYSPADVEELGLLKDKVEV